MYKTDFKVGDKVVCMMHGEGVVDHLWAGGTFRAHVLFDRGIRETYTVDGCTSTSCNRTLFHANSGIVEFDTTVHPDIEPGQVIWVRGGSDWFVRHFSHFENGRLFCFNDGRTEGITSHWPHYSLAKPEASHVK